MPQRSSYFAISLPKGWWIFGLDHGLETDIDIDQFNFFANVASKFVKESDSIVILNHEPAWVIEADAGKQGKPHEKNVRELIDHHLQGKVRLRIAGDLHHYTRHVPLEKKKSDKSSSISLSSQLAPQLIVSGGGGAFLHGTHTFAVRNI